MRELTAPNDKTEDLLIEDLIDNLFEETITEKREQLLNDFDELDYDKFKEIFNVKLKNILTEDDYLERAIDICLLVWSGDASCLQSILKEFLELVQLKNLSKEDLPETTAYLVKTFKYFNIKPYQGEFAGQYEYIFIVELITEIFGLLNVQEVVPELKRILGYVVDETRGGYSERADPYVALRVKAYEAAWRLSDEHDTKLLAEGLDDDLSDYVCQHILTLLDKSQSPEAEKLLKEVAFGHYKVGSYENFEYVATNLLKKKGEFPTEDDYLFEKEIIFFDPNVVDIERFSTEILEFISELEEEEVSEFITKVFFLIAKYGAFHQINRLKELLIIQPNKDELLRVFFEISEKEAKEIQDKIKKGKTKISKESLVDKSTNKESLSDNDIFRLETEKDDIIRIYPLIIKEMRYKKEKRLDVFLEILKRLYFDNPEISSEILKATIELLAQRTDNKSIIAITNAILTMNSELDASMLISIITGSHSDRETVVDLLFHTRKKPNELVQILIKFLQEDKEKLKKSTYEALGKTKTTEAAKILIKALKKEKNPDMRLVLIKAVGNIKTKETVQALIKVSKNKKELLSNVMIAVEKIGELQAEEAIPFLIECLKEKYYFDVRNNAAIALIKIGEDSPKVLTIIEEFIEKYRGTKYNVKEVEHYYKEMKSDN